MKAVLLALSWVELRAAKLADQSVVPSAAESVEQKERSQVALTAAWKAERRGGMQVELWDEQRAAQMAPHWAVYWADQRETRRAEWWDQQSIELVWPKAALSVDQRVESRAV